MLLNSFIFRFNFILHIFSIPSCYLTSILNLSLNSSTNSFVFSKSSFFSHKLFSTIKPLYLTKYFFTSYIFLLSNIFSTSYSSTPSTFTGFGSFTFCSLTSSLYLTILLTFLSYMAIFVVVEALQLSIFKVVVELPYIYRLFLSFIYCSSSCLVIISFFYGLIFLSYWDDCYLLFFKYFWCHNRQVS